MASFFIRVITAFRST